MQGLRGISVAGVSVPHGIAAHEWTATLTAVHRILARAVPRRTRTEARGIAHHCSIMERRIVFCQVRSGFPTNACQPANLARCFSYDPLLRKKRANSG